MDPPMPSRNKVIVYMEQLGPLLVWCIEMAKDIIRETK